MKRMLPILAAALVVFMAAGFMLQGLKNSQTTTQGGLPMIITSTAYADTQPIPAQYTCDGSNVNPPLSIADTPTGAKSLALILDDLDSPGGIFTHWLFWNVDPSTTTIPENSQPEGTVGTNSFGSLKYGGPCPNTGTHRYVFTVYALDIKLELKQGSGKSDLEKAIAGHILTQGQLTGTYQRP